METLKVAFTLAAPLLSGEPRQGNSYRSYSYLPGSVVRGAVASALMAGWSHAEKQKAHPEECADPANCSFCRVMYPLHPDGTAARSPRFYDCYPAVAGSRYVQPLPLTARTCKHFSGFRREDSLEEHHGVWDTLIAQAAAQAALSAPEIPYVYTFHCPICQEPAEPVETDWYGRYEDSFYTAQPINRRFSRTAINRRRRTAQNGQLFTLTVMGEQMHTGLAEPAAKTAATRLEGLIETGDAPVDELRQALEQVGWLGSGSSRGLGQVDEVRVEPYTFPEANGDDLAAFQTAVSRGQFQTDADHPPHLFTRLFLFNEAVQAERNFYRALGVDVLPAAWYFTLDLMGDLFMRIGGLPALQLPADSLQLAGAELVFTASAPVDRGGWSNAWGLPRPRQLGLAAGSVFMYAVQEKDTAVTASLVQRLAELEMTGIGLEQERGAGRVMVCAPFHQEVNPV